MTLSPNPAGYVSRVSARPSLLPGASDLLAGVERSDVPPVFFIPAWPVDVLDDLAERHERLTQAAKQAAHGDKLRLQGQAYRACHARLAAELAVSNG